MKAKLIVFLILVSGYVSAQLHTDKQLKAHMKEVQNSKDKQSILWDMDTVFVSGIPYCIIIKITKDFLTPSDYSVRSLQGYELIHINHQVYTTKPTQVWNEVAKGVAILTYDYNTIEYYTWHFSDMQKEIETSADLKIYKVVVENNLIQGNNLNKNEEALFVSNNVKKFSPDTNTNLTKQQLNIKNPDQLDNIVNRNRTAEITILHDTIRQNNMVIGTVKILQYNENKTAVKILSVYLPDGKIIAEGKAYGINSNIWTVATLKDDQIRMINSSMNNDEKDVLKYLVTEHYL